MCQATLADPGFYPLLLRIDREEVTRIRKLGCPCGGRLDQDDYPRKPRGPFARDALAGRRFGLCCARCRQRRTPASVRFLGRRVYFGFLVVLASAVAVGLTGWRLAYLAQAVPIPRSTIRRWMHWWATEFVSTPLWMSLRASFLPPLATTQLPAPLLQRVGAGDEASRLVAVLQRLAPLSTLSEER